MNMAKQLIDKIEFTVDDSLTEYDEVGNIRGYTQRSKWVIDNKIPIFTQDRNYIERLI